MVPIEGKAVQSDEVYRVQHTVRSHQLDEMRIDGGDSAEHNRQVRIHPTDGFGSRDRHLGEHLPVGVDLEIPVGKIVRLIPEHYCFNHESSSLSNVLQRS